MSAIDRYIDELRRSGDTSLILQSESEPRIQGKAGERSLKGKTGHKEVTTLVEEIVPPECFADLVMMEPVEFVFKHEAGELAIRVVPGPSIWRVAVDVRGDGLAPMPASRDEEDAAADDEAEEQDPEQIDPDESAPPSGASWSEIEQIVGPGDHKKDEDEVARAETPKSPETPNPLDEALEEIADQKAGGDDDDVPLSEVLLREQGDDIGEDALGLADEDDGDIDLAAFVPPSAAEPPTPEGDEPPTAEGDEPPPLEVDEPPTAELNDDEEEDEDVQRRTTRLQRGKPGADPTLDDDAEDEDVQRRTTRLQRGEPGADPTLDEDEEPGEGDSPLGAATPFVSDVPVDAVAGEPAQSDFEQEETALREPSDTADTGEHEVRKLRPVEPLDIDFSEEEVPQHAIARLDAVLDAAWAEGATGVLLRDGRIPQMVRAGPLRPVPLASLEQGHMVHDIVDIVSSPSQVEQLELRGQCRFVYVTGGSGTRVRCTLVKDGGKIVASIRRIGDEHLPEQAEKWLSQAVQRLLPPSGLVLVAGGTGQGKTTTAAALATMCHGANQQTLVVAEPLERRLPDEGAGLLQRHIPEDVPNGELALADAHMLEAPLVLVDLPRPSTIALDLLALAGEGRLVIATWTAEHAVEAIQGLMDALPAELAPAERARRVRSLSAVVSVHLLSAKAGGVVPIFEALKTYPALLAAIAESRLDEPSAGELLTLSFQSSRNALKARGLI